MRSSKVVRFVCISAAAFALSVVALSSASAQDATQAATDDMSSDMMMSHMMMQAGACPEGRAAVMLDMMMNTATEAPAMSATEDMSMAMTETPMMSATEDMGMASATEEMMGVTCLFGTFSGAAEVPGPGDTDGSGVVFVSVDPSSGDICYEEAVANITLPASATHIHVNAAGVSGDVVVPFPTAPDADGKASGCTNANVEGLAEAIASNPEGYYVNVHTSDFPAGAVRAQLSDWSTSTMNPDMDMMGEMMTPEATASSAG